MKWGITSSLLLDATWRTDFSQVEADEQQINLTRFSTFFPEKRAFFLESAANFQIGFEERTGPRRDLVPFFTRRIGLSGGEPVPVIGGVRVTGQAGNQTVGALNMQTRSFNGEPGDNFTAMVLRRRLSTTTSLAGIYLGRESKGPDSFNRLGGFDFRYTPRRTFEIEAFALRSETDGQPGDWAGRTGFLLDSSRHYARVGLVHIGDAFRNDLGFVQRRGTGTLFSTYELAFRPSNPQSRVLQHTLGANFEATTDDRYARVLTRIGGVSYDLQFSDGGILFASASSTFERIDTPFPIGPLTVPPGEYSFPEATLSYTSNQSAVLSGYIEGRAGDFWTGHQRAAEGRLRVRMNAHVAASATLGRSVVDLAEGSFVADLVGLRLDWSFTPRMFLNVFVQYNGETDTWLSNIRYNLIHRPLSDIYVVWNETRLPGIERRALLVKYTHLIAF